MRLLLHLLREYQLGFLLSQHCGEGAASGTRRLPNGRCESVRKPAFLGVLPLGQGRLAFSQFLVKPLVPVRLSEEPTHWKRARCW